MAIEEDWIDIWGRELLRELPGFAQRRVGPEYCEGPYFNFRSRCHQPPRIVSLQEVCQYRAFLIGSSS